MRKVTYTVAKRSDVLPDTGLTVPLGDGGECTLFLHQGRYFAVGSLCPHQNAPLSGAPILDGALVCRRHGYRFDVRTGECLTLSGYGLPTYPVTLCDDSLAVTCWEFD